MSLVSTLKNEITKTAYYIGFLREEYLQLPKEERYDKVAWLELNGYKGGWFADPFFLSMDGNRIQLLVEEKVYSLGRGIITHLDIEVDGDKFILKSHTPVLTLQTHLSFPNIWREDNKVYVYPENWNGGSLKIYEFDERNKKLVNPRVLINEPLVDSQLFKLNGKFFIIGVRGEEKTKESLKKALVFNSDSLFGPYHYLQDLTSDKKIERGAGIVFSNGKDLIRPVQKCESNYGEAVILNKLSYDGQYFTEEPTITIEPDKKKNKSMCLHTFNMMDGLCVIDGRDYIYPRIMKLIKRLK